MNITVGPVLLDFPYMYPLDGKKLYCLNKPDGFNTCGGAIDYDLGFNNLICTKCGRRYQARELSEDTGKEKFKLVTEGEDIIMKVKLYKGEELVRESESASDVIITDAKRAPKKNEVKSAETGIGTVILAKSGDDKKVDNKKSDAAKGKKEDVNKNTLKQAKPEGGGSIKTRPNNFTKVEKKEDFKEEIASEETQIEEKDSSIMNPAAQQMLEAYGITDEDFEEPIEEEEEASEDNNDQQPSNIDKY